MRLLLLILAFALPAFAPAATSSWNAGTYSYDGVNAWSINRTITAAAWEFEGTGLDWTVNGNNLTNAGTAPYTTITGQTGNNCIGPFSSSNYFYAAKATRNSWAWASSFAISGRVFFETNGWTQTLFYYTTASYGFTFLLDLNPNYLRWGTSNGTYSTVAGPTLTAGNWYDFYAEWVKSTNAERLIVNLTPVPTVIAVGTAVNTTATSITLGVNSSISAIMNTASMDHIRVYVNATLNPTQIAQLMTTPSGFDAPVSPPATYTPTYTPTQVATPANSPTPAASITSCSSPFPAQIWTPAATNPQITPTYTADQNAVFEPSVVKFKGTWYQAYTHGWTAASAMLMSGSSAKGPFSNLYGTSQFVGQGVNGASGNAMRGCLWTSSDNNYLQFYFSDAYNIYRIQTTDPSGLGNWSAPITVATYGQFPNANGLANIGLYRDPGTGILYAMIEASITASMWHLTLWKSTNDGYSFTPASNSVIASLEQGQGASSCARSIYKSSTTGLYNIWYHIAAVIYHATSRDLYNWFPDPTAILRPTAHLWGMTACNQTVDACVVQDDDGSTVMWFDATDNATPNAMIGYLSTNLSLEQVMSCANTTPSYTPTPTPSSTPTSTSTPAPTPNPCVWNFDAPSTQGWIPDTTYTGVTRTTVSTAKIHDGSYSLAASCKFTGSGKGTYGAAEVLLNCSPLNLVNQTMTAYVYFPAGMNPSGTAYAHLFYAGTNWNWNLGPSVTIPNTAGWVQLSEALTSPSAFAVNEVGVQIGGMGAWNGTIYLDSIGCFGY